jgi:phenylacetate-coenzyme A ligase PaaK-like adenylate-forming protein
MADYETLRERHATQYRELLNEHLTRIDWPEAELRAEQTRRLRALVATAQQRSPWHRKRLAHVDPARVTAADLPSLPTMTKDDLMANFDAIVTDPRLTRVNVEAHLDGLTEDAYLFDAYHVAASGGSSGTRGVYVYDWEGWVLFFLAFSRLRVRAQLADPAVGLRCVRAVIAGGKASHMSYALAQTFGTSGMISVPATLPISEIIARLNEAQPVMLSGYPSMIATLARQADAGHLRIAPRLIGVSSEPLLPEMREAIEMAWGCPVLNTYATSEGATAGSCGQDRGMHLNEDLCIFEPVDSEGRPVPAGQRAAKLFITPLLNHAQPLIRYELTDEVTIIDEPCPCGSNMRRIDDIQGRTDDLFVYEGGVIVHPQSFRAVLGRQRHVLEYQVHQTERGAAIAFRGDGELHPAEIRDAIERELARLGLSAPAVTVERVDGFERQATGKLKRFFPLAPAV